MTERALLRASDADRERVAERLRHAATEGRLLAEELEERLGAAFSARTYGQLDALVADLPNTLPQPRRAAEPEPRRNIPLAAIVGVAMAVMLLAQVAFSAAGHVRPGHEGMIGFHGGAPFVWLLWLAIGWRLYNRRRRNSR